MPVDPLTIVMLAILALLIVFMFRNSRKRQREQQELSKKVIPGANVMTNFGLFGKILSIDEDESQVRLETSPGTVLTLHRQAIARVVDKVISEKPEATKPEALNEDSAPQGEPEYGERIEDSKSESDAVTAEKADK
jgi:preprotein translocase subunit YajC